MRTLLALALVVAAALPAVAAPDAVKDWRKGQKVIDKAEAEYWDAFRSRSDAAFAVWRSEWQSWRAGGYTYVVEGKDLTPYREIYDEYVEVQKARTKVDQAFAASGHERAAAMLFDALLDAAKAADGLEQELAEGRPVRFQAYYDQEPSIRRHGIALRMEGLEAALAEVPNAGPFLAGAAWDKAVKADKKKSLLRRVAVLDALGRLDGDEARGRLESALRDRAPGIRIAAAENLVLRGVEAIGGLKPLLGDVSHAVRRALLHAIRTRALDVQAWIPVVLDLYEASGGLLRARALLTLQRLTGQRTGDDHTAWRTWFDAHEQGIADGTWVRPEDPVAAPKDAEEPKEAEPPAPLPTVEPSVSFYGVGAPGDDVVFVVDGTERMTLPASYETEKKKARAFWDDNSSWRKEFADHMTVLKQQLGGTLTDLGPEARFAVVYLNGSTPSRVPVLGEKKPLVSSKGTVRKVLKVIEKARPGGRMSCDEGLRRTALLWGLDPFEDPDPDDPQLDTVFLLGTGYNAGRWVVPEALIAAFERANRFRRLQVHTLRYSDIGAEAEALLKGLAEVSEGSYTWLTDL